MESQIFNLKRVDLVLTAIILQTSFYTHNELNVGIEFFNKLGKHP